MAASMRAGRQPGQGGFVAEDTKDEGLGRAVERRGNEGAAGPDEACGRGEEQRRVGDVLDDFEGEHGIEALAGGGDVLRRRLTVLDVETRTLGMRPGDRQRRAGGV